MATYAKLDQYCYYWSIHDQGFFFLLKYSNSGLIDIVVPLELLFMPLIDRFNMVQLCARTTVGPVLQAWYTWIWKFSSLPEYLLSLVESSSCIIYLPSQKIISWSVIMCRTIPYERSTIQAVISVCFIWHDILRLCFKYLWWKEGWVLLLPFQFISHFSLLLKLSKFNQIYRKMHQYLDTNAVS